MQIGIPFLPSFHLLMSDACYFSNGDVALFTQTPIKQFSDISEDGVGADGQGGHPLGLSRVCIPPVTHTVSHPSCFPGTGVTVGALSGCSAGTEKLGKIGISTKGVQLIRLQ